MKEKCRFFTSLAMASVLALSVCSATAETAKNKLPNRSFQKIIQQKIEMAQKTEQSTDQEESKDFLNKLEEDGYLSADIIQKIRTFLADSSSKPQAEDSDAVVEQDDPVLNKISELVENGVFNEELKSAIEGVLSAQGTDDKPMNGQLTVSRLNEMLDSGILNQEEVETIVIRMLIESLDKGLSDQSITQPLYDSIMDALSVG